MPSLPTSSADQNGILGFFRIACIRHFFEMSCTDSICCHAVSLHSLDVSQGWFDRSRFDFRLLSMIIKSFLKSPQRYHFILVESPSEWDAMEGGIFQASSLAVV